MANPPKVYVDGNLVVASGTVCVPSRAKVSIIPVPINDQSISVHIDFEINASGVSSIKTLVQGTVFNVTLVNADNHAGVSFREPLPFGWLGNVNRKLRLLASAQLVGEAGTAVRLFTYTITVDGDLNV